MSRTQRVVLLGLAVAVLVAAVIIRPGGGDDDEPDTAVPAAQTSAQEPSPEAPSPTTATTQTTPKSKPKPPLLTANSDKQLEFQKGDTIRFRVRHNAAEEIHVHGYDVARDLPANKTVTMSFKANLEGIFEVELEHSATPLGTIKVEPK